MKLKKKKRFSTNICSLEISLWLLFLAFETIEGTEITCGLGPLDNYAEWIADERGGLKFPDYKAEDNTNCNSSVIQPKDNINNSSEVHDLCSYSEEENTVICREGIDFIYLSSVLNKTLDTLIIDKYNGKVIQVPQNILSPPSVGALGDISEDIWRGTGDIKSTDIGLGVRLTTEFSPNKDYNGYKVQGEAFSNGNLKLGWKFEGDISIKFDDEKMTVSVTVETVEQEGVWKIESEFTNDGTSDDWTMAGFIKSKNFPVSKIDFTGEVKTQMLNDSWTFSGNTKLKQVSLAAETSGSVSASKNEAITIRKEAFSGMGIKHVVFQNSNFMKDFDKDAFQGLENLETISFINNKMEEIPRLDLFFKNLTSLKAIYIEDCIVPNLEFGNESFLYNLEYLSLKGSGPIELKDQFYAWITLPNLKYLNLQNSNIKTSFSLLSYLVPYQSSLRFLDVSYTPLTTDPLLWEILRTSSLTRLSAAGLQLQKVPTLSLSAINDTIEYLSLRGNSFEKIPEENMFDIILNFPTMGNLKELDLTQCKINYIERGVFDKMPNLETLFLSYNSIENLQEGWTVVKPQIKVLDLSYNSAGAISSMITTFDIQTENNFEIFEGLEILDLSNGVFPNLENLVSGLGNNLKLLSVCNSNLKNLTESMFYNLNKLVVLDMSNNEHIQLNEKMSFKLFKSLKSLRYLYLKSCKITNSVYYEIEDVFENNTNHKDYILNEMEILDLSDNNIKVIEAEAFKLFPNLKLLDLSGNSITTWSESLKKFNDKLETVFLVDNKIDTLTPNMLSDIYRLKQVMLGKNPFVCGCYVNEIMKRIRQTQNGFEICHPKQIKALGKLLNESRKYYVDIFKPQQEIKKDQVRRKRETRKFTENNVGILNFIERMHSISKCTGFKEPDISSSGLKKIKENCVQVLDWSDDNYTCYSGVESRAMPFGQANITAECNKEEVKELVSMSWLYVMVPVVFSSLIILGLAYWKRWEIKLFTKAVKNAAVLSIMGRKDYEPIHFQYHVFVSYSDNDRRWVLENLLPHLESWNDLKVCLHERDFQVGLSILENIMASIDKSQSIMLVLSKSFIKSQWCQYEMQLAHHRLLETRREELIIILLEHIPKSKRPKTLQYLMMTKTYIQWPSNPENKVEMELFWNRVYKALRNSAAENHI